MKSSMKSLWVGIRVERAEKSSSILRRAGFRRSNPGELNNRNAVDWQKPCGEKTLADFAPIFEETAAAGLMAIAFQWTDLQRENNAGLTDTQWQGRVQIGLIG